MRCIEQVEALIAAYRRRCGGPLAASAPQGPSDAPPLSWSAPAANCCDPVPVRMTREAMKKLRPVELLVLAGLVRDGDVVHYKRRSGPVQAYGTIKCVMGVDCTMLGQPTHTGGPAFCATTATRWWAVPSLSAAPGARCAGRRKTFTMRGDKAFSSCWGWQSSSLLSSVGGHSSEENIKLLRARCIIVTLATYSAQRNTRRVLLSAHVTRTRDGCYSTVLTSTPASKRVHSSITPAVPQ